MRAASMNLETRALLTYACLGVSLHFRAPYVGTLLWPSRHPGQSRFEFRVSWLSHRLWRYTPKAGVLNGMASKSAQPSEDLGPGKTGRMRIQDVAQAAGVSITSVSNYLNDRHQRLGADTRARIAQTISDLEFRPN